ncbi:MAG: SDR family oxidoreductase [Gemmatimonadaceae bacterium]|nr:SDR family oxidoreductase [Gloeobacterales cyanobacterium ES-bin-141]
MADPKVVLITGGDSEIGRTSALLLAREGARLVLGGHRIWEGEETAWLARKDGGEAIFMRTDIANEEEVRMLINLAVITYGRLDAAFNNTTAEGRMAPLSQQNAADFDSLMNTIVRGVYLSMKYEIPQMIKNGGGSIVNMGSVAGLVGVANAAPFAASQHAVLGLTRSAALEVARQGIRVNVLSPAAVETRVPEGFPSDEARMQGQYATESPIGRACRPEEIARAVLWLCSDFSVYFTGQSLTIDGGYTAH